MEFPTNPGQNPMMPEPTPEQLAIVRRIQHLQGRKAEITTRILGLVGMAVRWKMTPNRDQEEGARIKRDLLAAKPEGLRIERDILLARAELIDTMLALPFGDVPDYLPEEL